MTKNICFGIMFLGVFFMTSCDKATSDVDTTPPISEIDSLQRGFATVNKNAEILDFEGIGSLNETNEYIESPNGSNASWFGFTLYLGNDFNYLNNEDEFTFGGQGNLAYALFMSDDSDPIDTSLTLELNTPYPSDILFLDIESNEELEIMEANDTYPGVGIGTVFITITQINADSYKGHFEGEYIETENSSVVPISGEFNVARIIE